jgi:hypothetical protein
VLDVQVNLAGCQIANFATSHGRFITHISEYPGKSLQWPLRAPQTPRL